MVAGRWRRGALGVGHVTRTRSSASSASVGGAWGRGGGCPARCRRMANGSAASDLMSGTCRLSMKGRQRCGVRLHHSWPGTMPRLTGRGCLPGGRGGCPCRGQRTAGARLQRGAGCGAGRVWSHCPGCGAGRRASGGGHTQHPPGQQASATEPGQPDEPTGWTRSPGFTRPGDNAWSRKARARNPTSDSAGYRGRVGRVQSAARKARIAEMAKQTTAKMLIAPPLPRPLAAVAAGDHGAVVELGPVLPAVPVAAVGRARASR